MTPRSFTLFTPAVSLIGLSLLLTACPADDVTADEEGTDTAGTTGDTDTTGTGTDTDTDTDTDTEGEDDVGDSCGDGILDAGEECDDGNTADGDGCSATCTIASCGLVWSAIESVESSNSSGVGIAVDAAGDLYTVGQRANNDNDIYVERANGGGVAWSVSFDSGNGNDAGFAIDLGPNGEVYVAGRMEADADAIWFASLNPDDGSVVWEQVIDGDVAGEDDLATGIAVTPDGDVVVVGQIRVGEGDDDVWVSKRAAGDGSEIWTSTWGGVGDGSFSTDRSDSVTVGSDGEIWVGAREHIAFDTQDATLLHFDADGGLVAAFQPQLGGSHTHNPVGVAVDDSGVYFAIEKSDFPLRSWTYRLGLDGSEQWVKTEEDWALNSEVVLGEDWSVRGLSVNGAGELMVGGRFLNEEPGEGIEWGEAWVARVDASGSFLCRGHYMEDDGSVIPPSLSIAGVSGNSAGNFAMTAQLNAGQGQATWIWTGYFAE